MANASTADLCRVGVAILLFGGVLAASAHAQQTTPSQPIGATPQDLAKSVHNPFEDFVKVSLQSTTGFSIGPHHNAGDSLNVQPVIPFSLNPEWDLFARPSLSVNYQPSPHEQFGLTDLQSSFFLSPHSANKWIWGILVGALRRITERNAGAVEKVLNSYFRERDSLEAISRKELLRRVKDGLVTVIDTRPAEEFAAGHLPGALNVPLRELKRPLRYLPRDQEIVAYCRGAYCVLSYEAVAELRKRGFKAFRLEEGYPEWRAAGLPIERSAIS
jgi:rhodanese-related sulfurtransferase